MRIALTLVLLVLGSTMCFAQTTTIDPEMIAEGNIVEQTNGVVSGDAGVEGEMAQVAADVAPVEGEGVKEDSLEVTMVTIVSDVPPAVEDAKAAKGKKGKKQPDAPPRNRKQSKFFIREAKKSPGRLWMIWAMSFRKRGSCRMAPLRNIMGPEK